MSKEINSNDSNSFPSNNGSNKSPNSNSSFSFGKYLKNPADIGIKKNEIWNQSNSEAHQNWNDYQSGPVHNSGSGFVPVTTHKIGTIGQQEFTTNPVSTANSLFGSGFVPVTTHKIGTIGQQETLYLLLTLYLDLLIKLDMILKMDLFL